MRGIASQDQPVDAEALRWVPPGDPGSRSGRKIFEGDGGVPFETGMKFAALFRERQIDAVFCLEDMLAIGVLHALLEQGVRVGQEFGLVGFDNLSLGWQVYPELTTISQNIFAKGEVATRTLLSLLREKTMPCTRLILPVELVRRKTA